MFVAPGRPVNILNGEFYAKRYNDNCPILLDMLYAWIVKSLDSPMKDVVLAVIQAGITKNEINRSLFVN